MRILITGSTSGIGFDTGIALLKKGHHVCFTVHRKNQIKTVIQHLKNLKLLENASVFQLDITQKDSRKLIEKLDIDCLICNAAIGYGGSILDISISNLEDNFKVNVFSNIELIQCYCSHLWMMKKPGKVIVISSIAGIIPIPFLGSYSATKASLISLITCLNRELRWITNDIKIKLIEPGIYNTGFNEIMIENKEKSKYFNIIENKITKTEKLLFKILGHNKNTSIVRKIVKAVETKSNRFIYSAPFFQKLSAKIYSFIH